MNISSSQPEKDKAISVRNAGYCHCCRSETYFECNETWLRDHYTCTLCYTVPRERGVQTILDTHFAGWEDRRIHESSPANNSIAHLCSDYSSSQFFPDGALGSTKNGIRCENLEQLTFGDDTFDIFVTKDVFEHVVQPDVAAREIHRVLKPGGFHIFTTPKFAFIKNSYPRVTLTKGKVVNLQPEAYHGNPIGNGRSLVTWDYGLDFEFLYASWTGAHIVTYVTRDRHLGLDGEHLEVFVARARA